MGLPQVNSSEAFLLASLSYCELMSRFLALSPVKSLQFTLAVTLIIGSRNMNKLKAEDNFGPLPPLYTRCRVRPHSITS